MLSDVLPQARLCLLCVTKNSPDPGPNHPHQTRTPVTRHTFTTHGRISTLLLAPEASHICMISAPYLHLPDLASWFSDFNDWEMHASHPLCPPTPNTIRLCRLHISQTTCYCHRRASSECRAERTTIILVVAGTNQINVRR